MQNQKAKMVVGSKDDIAHIVAELQKLNMVLEPTPDILASIDTARCKLYYTQTHFAHTAEKLQANRHLACRLGAIGIIDRLQKQINAGAKELSVILYDGNRGTENAEQLLTLSPT